MRPRKADLIKRKVKCSVTKQGLEGGELNCLKVFQCFFLKKYPGIRLIIAEYLWPLAISDWSPHVFFWYKACFCHLLSWFIFPLLLGKLVSSLFQSSIVKRTRSNYCGLSLMFLISLTDFIHRFIFFIIIITFFLHMHSDGKPLRIVTYK